jgi:molybdopterin/thiamine biosynthesis adenylyltransferase
MRSAIDLILQERHLEKLRSLVLHDDRVERAAYILCGTSQIASDPWDRQSRQRFTSFEVLAIPPDDAISASALHVTWSTRSYVRLLRRAQAENLVAGIVHVHPGGPPAFSDQDDRNEADLAQLARNRNGEDGRVLSLLLTGQGEICARFWPDPHGSLPVDVSVVGRHITVHRSQDNNSDLQAFARQALAFGPELTPRLRGLKVGIVGCGGTGSATAMLLARLGVGQLVLFDDDVVDVTNLNRLHGAKRGDANAIRAKVDVVAREIAEMALGTRVVPVRGWIGEPQCRDALRSCDVVFGCTDDHAGRLMLNRFAYFYLIPVVDMGLAVDPRAGGGVQDLSGRVTVLVPGAPCLLCRGIIDPILARDEELKRQHPEEYERRKREAYVRGAGNPAPAVVTFTTATACLAVDELLQALTCFRGPGGWVWHRVRRYDLLLDRRPGCEQDQHCPICVHQDYWGRGDIEPFLDRTN